MNYGIKISKEGFDVLNEKRNNKPMVSNDPILKTKPHLLYVISLAYLLGAREQIERYKVAASQLKSSPITKVYECLHEVSTLFEDLATVSLYAKQCGHDHKEHDLWINIRNHIRHDIRENFDKEAEKRKVDRATELKIPQTLQTNIGFSPSAIKIGGITVDITRIEQYLEWAEKNINETLVEAKEKGYFNNKLS